MPQDHAEAYYWLALACDSSELTTTQKLARDLAARLECSKQMLSAAALDRAHRKIERYWRD